MIFDSNGLPKDTGASDFMDSCRLAGMMALFSHPQAPDMTKYLINGEGVRHPQKVPANNPKNFTRDQLIALASGLAKQGKHAEVKKLYEDAKARGNRAQNTEYDVVGSAKKFPNGADWLSPSHMNHLRICANMSSTLLGKAWLIADIAFHSFITPMNEPNQLMCMCEMAGERYKKMFKSWNKKLKKSITSYWAGWRAEPDFAEFLISRF